MTVIVSGFYEGTHSLETTIEETVVFHVFKWEFSLQFSSEITKVITKGYKQVLSLEPQIIYTYKVEV